MTDWVSANRRPALIVAVVVVVAIIIIIGSPRRDVPASRPVTTYT